MLHWSSSICPLAQPLLCPPWVLTHGHTLALWPPLLTAGSTLGVWSVPSLRQHCFLGSGNWPAS